MGKICEICKKEYTTKQSKPKQRFCSSRCYGEHRKTLKGKRGGNWKGGIIFVNGYRYIFSPNHPFPGYHGYQAEHRLKMEKKIGRFLDPKKEIVHHKNGVRTDNRLSNLHLASRADHLLHHLFGKSLTNKRKLL